MATTRSYSDACGMAHALDLVGERWAMHVVRELLLGPKRYTDLKADLPGISTTVLGDRLGALEENGLLVRRRLDPPAATWVYELTPYGRDLEPIICTLGRWAARSPSHRPDLPISVTSFVLSLRTNVDPDRTAGPAASYALQLDGVRLAAELSRGAFTIEPGVPSDPVARITAEPAALGAVIYGGRDLAEAVEGGDIGVDGDDAELTATRRFVQLFTLPVKVAVPAGAS